jgi:hypothetical protein
MVMPCPATAHVNEFILFPKSSKVIAGRCVVGLKPLLVESNPTSDVDAVVTSRS